MNETDRHDSDTTMIVTSPEKESRLAYKTRTAEVNEDVHTDRPDELHAMRAAYAALEILSAEARRRAVAWLTDSLGISDSRPGTPFRTYSPNETANSQSEPNSNLKVMSPRDFMSQKKPHTQVERIACLAYYATHYRDIRHVRSLDIAELNLEAAGQKFGNISRDIDNADRQSGYIVAAGNGAKQLTTRGEAVVDALPSREDVKLAQQEYPYRAKRSASRVKTINSTSEDER